jgi:putative PIN family toxin of toxin-antitoxin system
VRVVFDTNLIVSGMLWSGSPHKVLQLAIEQRVIAITSEGLVEELRDVLKRKKFEKYLERLQKTPEMLVMAYLDYATVVEPSQLADEKIRDADDVKVLEVAIGGKASYIVSGDDDLLSLRNYAGIAIITARQLLDFIHPNDTP